MTMTNKKMKTLQRKIKDMKVKLKNKLVNNRPTEVKETTNTSDFIWVGGIQPRKRKRNHEEEIHEHFSLDISGILSMLNKKENTMMSPAKRARHSDIWQVPRQGNGKNKTSTPVSQSKKLDFQPKICALNTHFESGPDFKIYDSYNYLVTPTKGPSYRNLVTGNTPTPPLPPRNNHKNTPPKVVRHGRLGGKLRQTLHPDFNVSIEKQIFN